MKTLNLTFFLFLVSLIVVHAQRTIQKSGESSRVYIKIEKELPKPPYLEIKDYSFRDSDGNKKVDAGEKTSINFTLYNSGTGPGLGLSVNVAEKNGIQGLDFSKNIPLEELKAGLSHEVSIPVEGLMSLQNGKALISIVVDESNGFDSDPLEMEIETRAFREPLVKVVDYQLSSQSSGTLVKRKPFDLEILVQNLGQGTAQNVIVKLEVPNNIFCLSANEVSNISALNPGEKRLLSYNLVTNNEYSLTGINLLFRLQEMYGKYAQDYSVVLDMNQKVSSQKLVVEGVKEKEVAIQEGSLTSEVDRNIPDNPAKNPLKIALIIGNEDYSGSLNAETNVEFARRDAETFREYALKTLGVEERLIFFFTNATAGTMKSEIERVVQLVKRMGSEAELILYYAGHGLPDENTKEPNLIPVDVSAANLASAIPLQEVYGKLSETGAKKITVILDACFSGGGRNKGLLAARGVRIKPKDEKVSGNMIVFAAASGEQSALPYAEQKHGMFTYFLLKKLQETKGMATFGELDAFLKSKVGTESLIINKKNQDPMTTVSSDLSDKWTRLTF